MSDLRRIEAQLHFDLGVTLTFIGERWRDASLIEKAVTAFRETLERRDGDDKPLDRADRQNVLGRCLFSLGEITGDPGFFAQAATAFRAALKAHTRECDPFEWAAIQGGLVASLFALRERDGVGGTLNQEVAALSAALEEGHSNDGTAKTNELGQVLFSLSDRRRDPGFSEDVATAFRVALEKRTLADWAKNSHEVYGAPDYVWTRTTEAHAYIELLEQKVAILRSALEERARERTPADWHASQSEIGRALSILSVQIGHLGLCEEGVVALRAALTGLSRERSPLVWAETQRYLGTQLSALGDGNYAEAAAALRAALEVYTREHTPFEWANAKSVLDIVLIRGIWETD